MTPARLPRYRADAWAGGFVVDPPVYTASISAVDGTVVAATECIYRLRPGATAFHKRELVQGTGDVMAVAVEPRRPGSPQRIAVATINELRLLDGKGVASVPFPEDHGEVVQLLWGPMLWTPPGWRRNPPGKWTDVLYVRCADVLLQLVPGGSPFGTFVQLDGPVAQAHALATDQAGGFAFACMDEENGDVEVSILADRESQLWHTRTLDAPDSFYGVNLAIAGKALAVSFGFDGGVWVTRDCKEHEFTEIEELRGRDDPSAAAIAFEGSADDAALFAAVRSTRTAQHIVRVDAEGRAQRIAEVEIEGGDEESSIMSPVRALAWDATRRTLWSAAGPAGIMRSTAPGALSLLAAGAPS